MATHRNDSTAAESDATSAPCLHQFAIDEDHLRHACCQKCGAVISDSPALFDVEIVRIADGSVLLHMGPHSASMAARVERGAAINLNTDVAFIRIVPAAKGRT